MRVLVEWSGAPACFATVSDSDVARVVGLAPGGREWRAVLGLEVAAEMRIDRPQDLYDDDLEWIESPQYAEAVAAEQAALEAAVPVAAETAIAWAAAAGVATVPAQGTIEEVLRSHEVFIEDSFIALIDALGFPPAIAPSSEAEA